MREAKPPVQNAHLDIPSAKRTERSSSAPPTAGQRHRRALPGSRDSEKLDDRSVESFRKLFENRDGRIFKTALQAADIGPVDAGVDSEIFLRKASGNAQSSEIPCDECLRLHRRRASA